MRIIGLLFATFCGVLFGRLLSSDWKNNIKYVMKKIFSDA